MTSKKSIVENGTLKISSQNENNIHHSPQVKIFSLSFSRPCILICNLFLTQIHIQKFLKDATRKNEIIKILKFFTSVAFFK